MRDMAFLRRSFSGKEQESQESNVASDYLWACIKKGQFPEVCSQSMRQELENYIPRLVRQTNPNALSFKQYLMQLNSSVFMTEVAWMYYYACLIPEIKALEKELDYLKAAKNNVAISYAVNIGNPFVLNFYCAGLTNQINSLNVQFEKKGVTADELQKFNTYMQELIRLVHLLKVKLPNYPTLACFLLATTNHHLSGCYTVAKNTEFLDEEKQLFYLSAAFFYAEMGGVVAPKYQLQTQYLTRGYDLFYGYFVKDFDDYKRFFIKTGKLTEESIKEMILRVKQDVLLFKKLD